MDFPEKPSTPVSALSRGIAILRYLNEQQEPAGVIQIARDLKINQSTCFNLLRTLVHERLAVFDPLTKKYTPGLGVLELASGVLERGSFVRLFHPRLVQVAQAYSATIILWRLVSPTRVLLVDLAEAPVPLRVHMRVGQRLPSLIGALGRCFAAHMGLTKARIKAMFGELRWQDPPRFEDYWADVEAVRRNGFAVDVGNFNRNFTTVAAPVCGPDGLAVMAISAIAFSNDLDPARVAALAEDLRRLAREAERAAGFDLEGAAAATAQPGPRGRKET